MNCVPRRNLVISRCLLLTIGWQLLFTAAGCASRYNPTSKAGGPETKEDPVVAALNRLDRGDDASNCREVLAAVDASLANRELPVPLTPERLDALAKLAHLSPPEAETLAQPNFTPTDAEYLADCFVVRDAVNSLNLVDCPPLEKAELAFAWVCRQVYISGASHPPAPPWWVLQAGSGDGLDRATVFMAVLQQLGLDGCFVGPPELASTSRVILDPKSGKQLPAPVPCVGVRIGADIYLFDPWRGAVVQAGGKTATLALLRSNPSSYLEWLTTSSIKSEDVHRWQLFLAAPLQALEPRMQWLEKQIPTSNSVRLYIDLPAMIERFQKEALAVADMKGVSVRVWNPSNDLLSSGRLLNTFQLEVKGTKGLLMHEFQRSHLPWKFLPVLQVDGRPLNGTPLEVIAKLFQNEFNGVYLTPNSARDQLLRGNFSNAVAALTDLKDRNDRLSERHARDKVGQADVDEWSRQAPQIFADVHRAEQAGNAVALSRATEAQNAFLRGPATEKMASLVRKRTSILLAAEASFQLALIMHERAERAAVRQRYAPEDAAKRLEAQRLWTSAADAWQRYLDNYPTLHGSFNDRDRHARQLQERCRANSPLAASR